jgi:hypothetical protein
MGTTALSKEVISVRIKKLGISDIPRDGRAVIERIRRMVNGSSGLFEAGRAGPRIRGRIERVEEL